MAVDRISMLPDELLHHILSFLPTQTAAATKTLSKRWTPLWLSVPALFFDDQTYLLNNKPYHFFTKFIYATILARKFPIRTFRLQCGGSYFDFSTSDLKLWVDAAIQRGLENLFIQLPFQHRPNFLSRRIFCCKTLVVLKLVRLTVDKFSSVHLPSLKTLHLTSVIFLKPHYFADLLAACPILEYMHVRGIYYFLVDYFDPSDKIFGTLSKLVRADLLDIDFDIFVGSLGLHKYVDDIPAFPNLTHVELMWGHEYMEWHLILAILNQCPMLQSFALDTKDTDYEDVVWISPSSVPECLSSQLRLCSMTNYQGTETELHFAKYIMQNSKVLRRMTICTQGSSQSKTDKLELLKELSSCPKSSTILNFRLNESE